MNNNENNTVERERHRKWRLATWQQHDNFCSLTCQSLKIRSISIRFFLKKTAEKTRDTKNKTELKSSVVACKSLNFPSNVIFKDHYAKLKFQKSNNWKSSARTLKIETTNITRYFLNNTNHMRQVNFIKSSSSRFLFLLFCFCSNSKKKQATVKESRLREDERAIRQCNMRDFENAKEGQSQSSVDFQTN